MRTETAIVKLAQITTRPDAQGNCKIVVRVQYRGRKEYYTSVAVPISAWDNKAQRVKAKYPNAVTINAYLEPLVRKVIDFKMECERMQKPYTAQMLINVLKLGNTTVRQSQVLSVKILIDEIAQKKLLKHNTTKNYDLAFKKIVEAYKSQNARKSIDENSILITELDETFCRILARQMKDEGAKNSSIQLIMAKISALWHYALDYYNLNRNDFPFNRFKYWEEYRASFDKKSIPLSSIEVMESYWIDTFLYVDVSDPSVFEYKKELVERLLFRHTKEFALTAYLLGYHFQGLALKDLAMLKANQVTLKYFSDGTEYYSISGLQRSKTGEPVPIVIENNVFINALLKLYLDTADTRDGYLLPICKNPQRSFCYDTEKKLSTAMVSFESVLNRKLRSMVSDINNKYEEERIPPRISYYSCRHSFATHYMQSEGAKETQLAVMMGRSPEGIHTYIQDLTRDSDILQERRKVYGDYLPLRLRS